MIPDTSTVVLLVGMAVGIDYSLFFLRRQREERARGAELHEAIANAARTSGRAIVVSGLTVMTALAGLFLTGYALFTGMAIGAIVVVGIAVAGSLTVLPALLSWLLPQTFGGTGVTYAVTGDTAENHDNASQLSARTPLVLAVVAAVAFCLLLFSFRSVVLPLVSIALNFLSVTAAYGLITLVFQDGRLQGLLGTTKSRPAALAANPGRHGNWATRGAVAAGRGVALAGLTLVGIGLWVVFATALAPDRHGRRQQLVRLHPRHQHEHRLACDGPRHRLHRRGPADRPVVPPPLRRTRAVAARLHPEHLTSNQPVRTDSCFTFPADRFMMVGRNARHADRGREVRAPPWPSGTDDRETAGLERSFISLSAFAPNVGAHDR